MTEGTHTGNVKDYLESKESNKWELVEEKVKLERGDPPFTKLEIGYFDIYRKKRWNGIYKYKKVKRY
jgi:hypothetical protein